MNCAMRRALVARLADIFHDVNLATSGPVDGINVCAQHPERGPDALSTGNLDARFHAAIGPRPFALGEQPRRGVTVAAVALRFGLDDQLSAHDAGVIGACGVIF